MDHDAALHIAFGVDANYLPPMAAAMMSIVDKNPNMKLVFHVVATGFSSADRAKIEAFAEEKGLTICVHETDREAFQDFPDPVHLTHATYNRFLICAVLKGIATKVLYLDSDIICLGSLQELFALEMGDKICAVVEDFEQEKSKQLIGLSGPDPYFNAGVLYIDVEKWNAHGITQTLFNLLTEGKRKLPQKDQDALNVALEGKAFFLERKWNLFFDRYPIGPDTIFLHYAGRKPWQMWSNNYQDPRFTSALARTPWAAWRFTPKSRKHRNKHAQRLLAKGHLLKGLYWYFLFLRTPKKRG